jgi:AraC family transcriptional regulator of adaptative response / DNA-3-methyladenine glycosylase II
LLVFLRRDVVEGVDLVDGARYGRTIELDGQAGFVFVENSAAKAGGIKGVGHVDVSISESLVPVLMPLLARLRQLFDLDAQPTVIDAHLAQGQLATLVARRPGIRIPGSFDGFDVALRAILRGRPLPGRIDPVSNALPARVAERLGVQIETGNTSLFRLSPTAGRVTEAGTAGLEEIGVPRRRATAAVAVAQLVAERRLQLVPGSDPVETHGLLTAAGVDDQLAHLIVMRTLSWPDTLPATDPELQKAAGVLSVSALDALAEEWRPWRTYAAMHLWLEGRRYGIEPMEK